MVDALLDDAILLCPSVGTWQSTLGLGALLKPGASMGRLRQSGRWIDVVAPKGTLGHVRPLHQSGEWCDRGTPLFELLSDKADSLTEVSEVEDRQTGLPDGAISVRSDTDGTVYVKPSPEAKAYTRVGARCKAQQTLALVEVMKTFSPVRAPCSGEVLAVNVSHGQAIESGDCLFWVLPDDS